MSDPDPDEAASPSDRDVERYATSYDDLAVWLSRSGDFQQLRRHMLTVGVAERVLPGPEPIPADWSDTQYRLACHDPEFAELLRLGVVGTGYYNAAARFGAEAGARGRISSARELVKRPQLPLGVLGQCAALDSMLKARSPLVSFATEQVRFTATPRPVLLPLLRAMGKGDGFHRNKDVAVLVPWLETGGAELGAYWFYRGAEALGFSPVLVLTETASVTPFFAEQGLNIVNLPDIFTRILGLDYKTVALEMKKLALKLVLDAMDVSIVHLVHSWVGYNLFGDPALAADPHRQPKLLVSAFCPHVHADGRSDGYYRHYPRVDAATAGYLCDSQWYAREIETLYGIESARTAVVRFPTALAEARPEPADDAGLPRILWASRLDFQKNPKVVFEIARRIPELQFDMFGRQVLSDLQIDWSEAPPNVTYRGEFFAFGKLPLHDYALFLYTSLFDGMPNILLEAAAHGMPIVSSAVGGIAELLGDGAGQLVSHPDDVDGYIRQINRVLADRRLRAGMIATARDRIARERSFESFVQMLSQVPLYRDLSRRPSPGSQPEPGTSTGLTRVA